MITVAGEALVDLVITPAGAVEAKLGGAPFNTARACGRLGAAVRFVGAISTDRFGTMLAAQLESDGVDVAALTRVDAPTTLAAAELDRSGAATYRFYIDATSAPALVDPPVAASANDVLFTGGLGLVLEPMASTVERAIDAWAGGLVMVDVNCRPAIVPDRDGFVARVDRVLRRVHVVKVSDEDLGYLRPGETPSDAAAGLLRLGPSAVLMTRGGDGVDIVTADGVASVPIDPVEVVDTIGAGDSFGAGFLSWWTGRELGLADTGSLEALQRAARAANRVAGVVVGRRGADPPWRNELPEDWSS